MPSPEIILLREAREELVLFREAAKWMIKIAGSLRLSQEQPVERIASLDDLIGRIDAVLGKVEQ